MADESEKRKEKEELERSERLEAMRERLYSRGTPPARRERRVLPDVTHDVPEKWSDVHEHHTHKAMDIEPPLQHEEPTENHQQKEAGPSEHTSVLADVMPKKRKKTYRMTLIVAGLIFFVVALILSGAFLFFGKNTISGENITIAASGPFAIGGGEEIPIQIAIANQNAVPIESATLIIEYPPGTQSSEEPGKELFRDRKQITLINPGEAINIPISAVVFGEENDEKTVNVSVEYRVRGSNATFFKEAEPLRFKISSSPVVLSVESIDQVASGQEVELKIMVNSNSPSDVSDVLVKAEYPFGFDYTESTPSPLSGRDTWRIEKLEPEEQEIITVRGVVTGKQDESQVFRFSVGVANERDRFSLASIFTTQTFEIDIEQPFLDVDVRINDSRDEGVVVSPGEQAFVSIDLLNTLSGTIYDGRVEVLLSGNALDDDEVEVSNGFYDSSTNKIVWDFQSDDSLDEIQPGRRGSVSFHLVPRSSGSSSRTPQITLDVSVSGRRVSEDRVSQELTGTVSRTIKVESKASLESTILHNSGPFTNTGPVPPEAEKVTTYTAVLAIENGSNSLTDSEVTFTLPTYVTWLDLTTVGSIFSYNSVNREVTWESGDLSPGEEREAAVQLSVFPSASQIGEIPTVIGRQSFRATDRFTGTIVRSESFAKTTELDDDPDATIIDGRVLPKDE